MQHALCAVILSATVFSVIPRQTARNAKRLSLWIALIYVKNALIIVLFAAEHPQTVLLVIKDTMHYQMFALPVRVGVSIVIILLTAKAVKKAGIIHQVIA